MFQATTTGLRSSDRGESFTNPSLSPPECRCFDDRARPSVIVANMEDKQRMWDEMLKVWLQTKGTNVGFYTLW